MHSLFKRLIYVSLISVMGTSLAATHPGHRNKDQHQRFNRKGHQAAKMHHSAAAKPKSSFPKVGSSNHDLRQAVLRLQNRVEQLQNVAISQHNAEVTKRRKGLSGAWAERLIFTGSLQTQASYSNRSDQGSFTKGNSYKLKINNVNLTAHARLMSYLNAILSLDSQPGAVNIDGDTNSSIEFEQAYIHFGDPLKSHLLVNVGRKFLAFGVYQHHPVLSSVTQVLNEYIKTTLEVGANYHPFYATAFLFNAQGNVKGAGHRTAGNGGLELGVYKKDPRFGYDISLGWINNLAEAKSIYSKVRSNYHNVADYALHVALTSHNWALVTDYTQPTSRFDSRSVMFDEKGAKPSGLATELSYSFLANHRPSTVAVGYQLTREALVFGLPKRRFTASYTYYLNHYANLVFEVVRDHDYGTADTAGFRATRSTASRTDSSGTGRQNTTAVVELGLHF